MQLIILGTGAPTATSSRASSGYLLKNPKGQLLLDLGCGVFNHLQKVMDPTKLNALIVSHFNHQDHINDLPPFLSNRKHLSRRKKFARNCKKPFSIFAGKGFRKFLKRYGKVFPFLGKKFPFPLKIKELNSHARFTFQGFSITCAPLRHPVPTLGFRFEHKGKTVVYSADTEYCLELVKLAQNADVLLADCACPNAIPGFHMGAKECAQVATQANVKLLVLTHFGPESEHQVNRIKHIARKHFNGKIVIAHDLMKIKI